MEHDLSAEVAETEMVDIMLPVAFNEDIKPHLKSSESSLTISLPKSLATDDLFFEIRRAVSVLVGAPLLHIDLFLKGQLVNLGVDVDSPISTERAGELIKVGDLRVLVNKVDNVGAKSSGRALAGAEVSRVWTPPSLWPQLN